MATPPLPPGFVLQTDGGDVPPPPPGFVLDRRKPAAAAPEPSYDPSEGMSGGEKFLVGAGYATDKAIRGVKDLWQRMNAPPKKLSDLIVGEQPDQGAEDAKLYEKYKPKGWQTTAGEIAGAIGTQAPLALIPGGLAAQMAIQGAGAAAMTPGDTATRAKEGAMAAGGTAAGNVLLKALGRVAKPIGDKAADTVALEARGIEPTFGQGMAAKGGLGKAIGAAEEGAMSVPIASGPLRATRERAMEQWRTATRQDALPPGYSGPVPKTVDETRQVIGGMYDRALQSERLPYQSVQYQPDMRALSVGRPITNEQRDLVEQTFEQIRMKNLSNPTPGVQPTAAAAHATESEMKALAARYKGSQDPAQQDLGQLFDEVARDYGRTWRTAIVDPNTSNAIAALDRAYPQFAAIRQAAKTVGAKASEGDPSKYTPSVLYRAARTVDRSVGKQQHIAQNAPQQELSRLGQTIETKLPDSGTAMRAMVAQALLGGGGVMAGLTPQMLAGGAGLAAYGTRPVQNWLMGRLGSGQGQEAILQLMREMARHGGTAGAGAARLFGG